MIYRGIVALLSLDFCVENKTCKQSAVMWML